MERSQVIFGHLRSSRQGMRAAELSGTGGTRSALVERDDDVVIVSALRTPICKARRGNFKDTPVDDLMAAALEGVIKDVNIDPALIGDICIGNVQCPGAGARDFRNAQFYVGIPETVPLMTVNRQCSSGLQALANIVGGINSGSYDIAIAGGAESLSSYGMGSGVDPEKLNPRQFEVPLARDCLTPMGITSENVAARFGISREKQDEMALRSHANAHRASSTGLFAEEIIPVTCKVKDKDGNEKVVTVSKDEGIRPTTTMAGLAKLKPAFQEGGSTTAGNSSQVSDGAAAVLVAKRSAARQHGLPVLGIFRAFAVAGVPPDIMGIGPAAAIPEALKKAGLTIDDIEVFEINEAFASQCTYSVEKLGIPMEKVNPNGGAIALGHPLGCTGARQVATLLHELKRRGKRAYGVISMCIGTGMGAAAVIEYPGGQ